MSRQSDIAAVRLLPKSSQIDPPKNRAAFWRFCVAASNRMRTITAHDLDRLLVDQKWKCAVSGISFETPVVAGTGDRRSPFGPSVDRIIPGGRYEIGNIRMVCNIVNFAMNEWGEDALFKLVAVMSCSVNTSPRGFR